MKRPVIWATIFMICGIYWRLGRSEVICLVSFLFLTGFILQYVIKQKRWKYLLLLLFLMFGFFSADSSITEETAEFYLTGKVVGEGVVQETGRTNTGNQKLTILCSLEDSSGEKRKDVKVYAIWSKEPTFEAGDTVRFGGELTPFYRASVPGGYDEELYLRTRGYEGKIYPDWMEKQGKTGSVSSVMASGRERVHGILDNLLPAEESGILKAMLTGDRGDIPDQAYDLYQKAGVVHILCISGLHMSVLALYVSMFMEKILNSSRRVSAAVTMAAALVFLLFIGFTPSAVRAVTMICVVMAARIFFRSHDRMNEIALAAFLILVIEPLYLFHIGFQLSFITVLGLCICAESREEIRIKDRTWGYLLKESLIFSLYASLFSFPFVAYYFYSVSLAGILANLVILPLSGMLLGSGILSAVLGLIFQPAGVFAAGSAYCILQIFEIVCTYLLKLPFAYVLVGRPAETVILLYYALLYFWIRYGGRKGSWKVAVLLCTSLFCTVFENPLFRRETTVSFLDVGQGDAAVIDTWDGKTYLVDGGGTYGKEFGDNVGETVLLPYLQYLGAGEIDAAFLSHPDRDHMTGLLEILDDLQIRSFYLADYPYSVTKELDFLKEMLEKYPIPLYTVDNREGSSGGTWTCLSPGKEIAFSDGEDNHGSMVLKYTAGNTEILFTGDLTWEMEKILLGTKTDVSADILKVSHHGSQYSSSSDFLENVGAKASVISCGKRNIYGHPHEKTLARLLDSGSEIYRTDTDGSILVRVREQGGFTIETMTERKPLYERVKEKLEKQ